MEIMKATKNLKPVNSIFVILLVLLISSCSAFQSSKKAARSNYEEGMNFLKVNQFDKAIESFSKAIELDPQYLEAYYGRGKALTDSMQYDRAMDDFDKATE